MAKKVILFTILSLIFSAVGAGAADTNYATYVFPVRGRDYWRQGRDVGQLSWLVGAVNSVKIPSTWLLHYDALFDQQILEGLKSLEHEGEKGLFLEVTRKLALDARVNYDWESEKWERADKVFLSGYEPDDRFKLIDTAMEKFKETFGEYPKSVGAWYIDSRSLDYLSRKFKVIAVLGCADQYITDGYQIWGQYVGAPYYPSLASSLEPALNTLDKISVVKLQWAAREPLLSYGMGPQYSNYSVQVNDYARFHGLGQDYLDKLIKTYTLNVDAEAAQITLGIEIGELEREYYPDVVSQLKAANRIGLTAATMADFAEKYRRIYPDISPSLEISSTNDRKTITWQMSPRFRSAILTEGDRSTLVDLRLYHQSSFYDNDWMTADKRQNLFRVVPARIDRIGLGNDQEIESSDISGLIKEPKQLKRIAKIGIVDALKLFAYKFVPDVRFSKVEGKWVLGWARDEQTLCLLTCAEYPYPAMEAFLGLRRNLKPAVKIFAAWEDTLPKAGQPVIKDVPYGVDNMRQLLNRPKKFENSYYYVDE